MWGCSISYCIGVFGVFSIWFFDFVLWVGIFFSNGYFDFVLWIDVFVDIMEGHCRRKYWGRH